MTGIDRKNQANRDKLLLRKRYLMSNYSGELRLSDISRNVKTPIPDNYSCPVGHSQWTDECPSCHAIYGDYSDVFS